MLQSLLNAIEPFYKGLNAQQKTENDSKELLQFEKTRLDYSSVWMVWIYLDGMSGREKKNALENARKLYKKSNKILQNLAKKIFNYTKNLFKKMRKRKNYFPLFRIMH